MNRAAVIDQNVRYEIGGIPVTYDQMKDHCDQLKANTMASAPQAEYIDYDTPEAIAMMDALDR